MSAGVTRAEQYISDVTEDIAACLRTKGCQPILFVGSGLSRRHFSGPSWDELLHYLAKSCPLFEKDYAYYKQLYGNPLKIGEEFAKVYREWAWGAGHNRFPKNLFNESVPADAYIKFVIAEYLKKLLPNPADKSATAALAAEIVAIKNIRPHAIITTNYDQLLEAVFPEYQPIIGQQIIQGANLSVGEIFKIHGCVSEPNSLVFTAGDYAQFIKRKKYLSAKLLTFFSEHPLLFIGYGAGDPNIRAILSDIDEALPVAGGVIPNVYILEWRQNIPANEYPNREKLIAIEDAKSVRINAIEADDFTWVFNAFGSQQSLNGVSPRILRALLARSYELVRHDIPRKVIEADFQMLEHAVENQNEFAKLFGLTTVSSPSQLAANYPYNLTQLSKKIQPRATSWAIGQKAINAIITTHGIDLKKSDNPYHCGIKYGATPIHKYSELALTLFKKVLAGDSYKLEMEEPATARRPPVPPTPSAKGSD